MKTISMWFALLIAAMLGVSPNAADAQKALVYCPVSDGATCATLVSTLTGTGAYPGGVDRAYDGTNGTVDLKTADLFAYTVFVVPSLADGAAGTPYALLRDATVVAKLRAALIGRRAFWSGTPDLGATNRDKKNALITNLVTWAGANFATVRGPGMVVLQDNSENASQQYDWVAGLTGVVVTSDYAPKTYASVRTISAAGVAILASGGSPLAYENMASYGFYFPNGAPGVSLDAVGQTGTAIGGEVVLVTAEGANTGGASIRTDKNDYSPGTTVVMTGAGFQAGESVRLTLHEDPLVHSDRTFTATADANGSFVFSGFAPEPHDLGVRFLLTAVGQSSGKRAQTTFTDGGFVVKASAGATFTMSTAVYPGTTNSCAVSPAPSGTVVGSASVTTAGTNFALGNNAYGKITVPIVSNENLQYSSVTASGTEGTLVSNTLNAAGTARELCIKSNNGSATNLATLTVNYVVTTATTSITSSLNPSAFGASVTFTATISPASATGTIQFKDGGANLGGPVTIASGLATFTTSALSVGTHAISAEYSPGAGFTAGAVTGVSQVVNKAPQTITFAQPASPTYGAAPIVLAGTATSNLAVTFTASGSCALGTGPQANTLSFLSAGACLLTALQRGDANYNAAPNVSYSITVAPKSLSVGSVTVANKVYDGTTAATITARTLAPGTVGTDAVTLTGGAALFIDKNVGTGKTVNVTGLSLAGANAANYTLASAAASTTADITALSITPSVTVSNKTYDGNTDATIATRSFTGKVTGDVADLTGGSASFATKAVGTAKLVTITGLSLQGADALNYALTTTGASAVADITPRQLAVGTITVSDKTYDANTSATISARTLAAGGVLGMDDVVLGGGTATFGTKAAGTNKPVNITGLSIGGGDAANYTLLSGNATSSATILPKSLTASILASSKVYDGTATAQATGSAPTIAGDAVTVTVTNAAFDNKNVGSGKPVSATVALDGADAANYTLTSLTAASAANITAKALSIASVTAADKEYDGTNVAAITAAALDAGVIAPDVVALTGGTATFDSKNVGNGKIVTAVGYTLTGADAGNYSLPVGTRTTTANITVKSIAGSAISATDKVYDGNTTATVTGTLGAGKVMGDALTLVVSNAQFDTRHIGTGKTVTANLALSGGDAANYSLAASTASTTAAITAKALVGSFTASSKTYDATTAATVATTSLPGVVSGDDVTLSVTGAQFATKQIGTGKTVTANLALAGAGAGNYTVNTTATATADITKATVNGSFTADSKIYDGNATATIATRSIGLGVLLTDVVTLTGGSASFSDKNVGTGKTVTGTGFSLGGTDGGNYQLAPIPTTTANITPKAIVPVITATSRIYDATTAAAIASRNLTGVVSGDAVTLTGGSATFGNKNVGTGKTVTASGFLLAGGDAGNYELVPASATATADITRAALTATATAANKTYDGNTVATPAPGVLSGVLLSDAVTLNVGAANFDTRNAGTGKTVTIAVSITGTDATNYTITTPVTATANITAKTITGSVTAAHKVYDASTLADITGRTLSGVIAPDVVSLVGGTATFDTKNVANGKTVTAIGLSLAGADKDNYVLSSTSAMTMANITAKQVTATASAQSKVYDGNTNAVGSAVLNGVIGEDVVTMSVTSANFDNKNAGTGKTVTVNIAIAGTDAPNYSLLTSSPTALADITKKALVGGFTAADKVYDGTTTAVVTPIALAGVVSGDAVTLNATGATFESKDVGDRTATANLSLTGGDAGNYTINPTSTAPAKILLRAVTATADAKTRVYGDADPLLTYQVTSGSLVPGELFAGAIARTSGENVGPYVIGQGTLALSANYALTYVPANLTITARPITVTAAPKSKTYGDPDPALTYSITTGNLVFSDAFTGALSRVAGESVGGNPYAITQGALTAGTNYALSYVGANLTINRKTIAPGALTVASKVYDATTAATIATRPLATGSVVGTDDVTLSGGTATFNDMNVGTAKPVSISGLTLTGTTAGNYMLSPTTASTTAEITLRPVTITAAAKTKVYGDADPALTYAITAGTLAGTDAFAGALTRSAGENVGDYDIAQGGVTLGTNYALSYVGAKLSITKRPVTITAAPQTKIEGGVDPALTYAISSGSLAFSDAFTGALTRTAGETVGSYPILQGTVLLTLNYTLSYSGASLTITPNAKPVLGPISLKSGGAEVAGPLPKGSTITLSTSFLDADVPESKPYTITVNWDDGSAPESIVKQGIEPITLTHTYAAATVATVVVTVTDKINTVASGTMIGTATQFLVIYDADAGFVTGGGWIDSPVGACSLSTACTTLGGKANFGFVAKYKRGATAPDGNTEFQFHAGGINFKSTSYQWLVVAGTKAQFKGVGTMNGSGNYTFLITAIDGDARSTGKGPDAFRIKISNAAGVVVYDNKMNVSEDSDAATLLGGGSIQIHDK